jgi:hypothetical protein
MFPSYKEWTFLVLVARLLWVWLRRFIIVSRNLSLIRYLSATCWVNFSVGFPNPVRLDL